MPSLWFVMPVHGRQRLAQICLRQLRRTCDALELDGTDASAVVIGEGSLLAVARELGFATVRRNNQYLSRKFNDGIQLATDKRYNPYPADYVVPIGSDNWVDTELFTDLPDSSTVVGFPRMCFVSEDGQNLQSVRLDYPGGAGIRIWPRPALKACGFRPADEHLSRGCDTSILLNVQRAYPNLQIEHRDTDPRQIVDWKTAGGNVNPYDQVVSRWRGESLGGPYSTLSDVYPADALAEMEAHYGLVPT